MDDAAELGALRIQDPEAAGTAAIDIALLSIFIPSDTPGSLPRRSANTRSVCFREQAIRQDVKGPDVVTPGIGDVERFIGGEREPIGRNKTVAYEAQGVEVGRQGYTPGNWRSHCSGTMLWLGSVK